MLYLEDYIGFLIAIVICMIFSAVASNKVKTAFGKYNGVRCRSGYTGYMAVTRLMRSNGVEDIRIGKVSGFLTDHYHPAKSVVNLSDSTYSSDSVAAVAVAAHEMGHVMQNKDGYTFYRIRTAIVPIVNFGTHLAMPLVLLGVVVDILSLSTDSELGFYIAMLGVILYGGSLLFALVTLPVELNASKRASEMLVSEEILTSDELPMARDVLSAAALTYLASLMTSLVYFIRFLLRVLAIFGRRGRRR